MSQTSNNSQSSPSQTWTNPIIPQRADPFVSLQPDGNYYFTASVPEYDRIELRQAPSLSGLSSAEPTVVWCRPASGPLSGFIWAPELHQVKGKWYIYFAASEVGYQWNIRMIVLENPTSDPFSNNWKVKGQIQTEWDSFSLDATTFEHRGVRYLAWAQAAPNTPGTNLYLAKMDTPWSITGPQVLLTSPTQPWERIGHNVNEGPAVLIRNQRIFMTYSASATDANYCMGLLTADAEADLLDPKSWKKSPTPVFASSYTTSQFGPGHNSFTTTPDGETDILVYHARNYEKIEGEPLYNPDRHTRAQVIHWNADGTPNFGTPIPDGPASA